MEPFSVTVDRTDFMRALSVVLKGIRRNSTREVIFESVGRRWLSISVEGRPQVEIEAPGSWPRRVYLAAGPLALLAPKLPADDPLTLHFSEGRIAIGKLRWFARCP
jgi:hypothetical protein